MIYGMRTNVVLVMVALLPVGCGVSAVHDHKAAFVEEEVVLRVYVVRHAQAYKNISQPPGTPEEKLDSLTPEGLKEAVAAGKYLKGRGIAAVITSPTGRTRQTAEAISKALELEEHYSEDSAFSSIRNGRAPDGRATDWSWRKRQLKDGRDPRPTDGESFQDGVARTTTAIIKLAEKYHGEAVVIVSHSDICAALLGHAYDTPLHERPERHDVATGSISEIVVTDEGWHLVRQNIHTRASPDGVPRRYH